ncbi:E3 ubiquitin-protein ligase RMA2-like [Typha angustifolia]|uniref:E3 ubiquitin-protein ligase RMA2-like n=1 Tax=Typha angustifolia TaxID=59011 RepID=UPI003C2D2000
MDPKLSEDTNKRRTQNDCFNCNICLEAATDPVVTLCGHLYCWPCIYKWLQQSDSSSPRHCPVCKATLSLGTLVPLYGRGSGGTNSESYESLGIPCRPSAGQHHRAVPEPGTPQGYGYPHPLIHYRLSGLGYSSAVGMAVALLPWVLRNRLPPSMFDVNPYGGSTGNSRQEREVERSLHQMWQFLVFFAALCLLLF